MRIKVPNQTDGEIVVTGGDLEVHHFPVAGDGTIEVSNELVAWHLLTTMEGAVAVGTEQANQPADEDSGYTTTTTITGIGTDVDHEGE